MLLYHEVEGTAKPVPPGVKHVIPSSDLPAPESAKLKESTAYKSQLCRQHRGPGSFRLKKGRKYQRKVRAEMPQVPEAINHGHSNACDSLGERRNVCEAQNGFTAPKGAAHPHSHSKVSVPSSALSELHWGGHSMWVLRDAQLTDAG